MSLNLDQIVDPAHPPRDIHDNHSRKLVKSMNDHEYHYGMHLRTALFSAELNSNLVSVSSLFNVTESRGVAKSVFVLVNLNGCHR